MLDFYKKTLGYSNMPNFLLKYLSCPKIMRLKKIGYFCGMDYASKNIYNFKEYISRYDHSLTVALLVYKLTKNKLYTIAAFLHDISTPCFSHVIDYMNQDYEKQESTEMYTEDIILSDKDLLKCLEIDNISISKVANFKNYSIVDNNRPHLCADRLDGIILTSIGWLKNITKEDIVEIINDLCITENNEGFNEIAFKNNNVAHKVLDFNQEIDYMCHTSFDNYMMELLAKITKLAIDKNYIDYSSLYELTEDELFNILDRIDDLEIKNLLLQFRTIKLKDIPIITLLSVKKRELNPLVMGNAKKK